MLEDRSVPAGLFVAGVGGPTLAKDPEVSIYAGVGPFANNRLNFFQTVRARLDSPASLAALKRYNDEEARLKLDVKSEAAYFAEQASQTSDLIQKLGWPLAMAMAFGALAGALNTMYSSVAARATEIATLRAIGFGGFPAFVGTLVESLVLAAIGGAVGAVATYLAFDGFTATAKPMGIPSERG